MRRKPPKLFNVIEDADLGSNSIACSPGAAYLGHCGPAPFGSAPLAIAWRASHRAPGDGRARAPPHHWDSHARRVAGKGACHWAELPYVFDQLAQWPGNWTEQDHALADTMAERIGAGALPNNHALDLWDAKFARRAAQP